MTGYPMKPIRGLVELLDEIGVVPLHLHIDGPRPTEARPDMRLWTRTRSDFLTVVDAIGVKAPRDGWERRGARRQGQRHYAAEADTDSRRLLIQCLSLTHHDDWEEFTP